MEIDGEAGYCQCDCCPVFLFRMPAVAKIGRAIGGLLHLAELEYGYRAQRLGLTGYIVHRCASSGRRARPDISIRTWHFGHLTSRRCRFDCFDNSLTQVTR